MNSRASPDDQQLSICHDADSSQSPDTSAPSTPPLGYHPSNYYRSAPPTPTTSQSQQHQSTLEVFRAASPSFNFHRQGHQGPQPVSPTPLPPQISAAELSQLSETSATNNGTFQCSHCNKQFGYKNGLIRHVRLTHVGEKPYQCNICNRRFGYKHILKEHQNLHFGNRPYACNMCDKRFAARSNLIQHRMVHKRPFNCGLCSKRFDREDQLKRHLFAHPQSLLVCSYCKYAGSSQSDINKHLLEVHPCDHDDPIQKMLWKNESEAGEVRQGRRSPGEQPHATDFRTYRSQASTDSRGRRIDAICSQLTSSVSGTGGDYQLLFQLPQQQQQQQQKPQQPFTLYPDVVIKKELVDEPETETVETGNTRHHHRHRHQKNDRRSSCSCRPAETKAEICSPVTSGYPTNTDNQVSPRITWSPHLPRFPASMRGAAGLGSVSFLSDSTAHKNNGNTSNKDKLQSSTLPGIHEVFSRHQRPQQKLPPFANFMPVQMNISSACNLPMPDLSLAMLSGQPHTSPSLPTSSFPHGTLSTASSAVIPTQRPTAQLPPIAHQTSRQTKDQAVQHSLSIAGFPSLDDVLSYYVSQGRLFKCQHCNILFFERGMYFLHASLHGLSSPWECSICHKVCLDKNEFTLHFVNQQHSP